MQKNWVDHQIKIKNSREKFPRVNWKFLKEIKNVRTYNEKKYLVRTRKQKKTKKKLNKNTPIKPKES